MLERFKSFFNFFDSRFEDLDSKTWKTSLYRDFSAGLVVAMTAIPMAMGFAMASGLRPEQGIIAGAIACLVGRTFGGSKYQVYGPTAAFIPLIYGIMQNYDHGFLVLVSCLAGVILMLMGLAGLGKVAKAVPESIIVGFTVGIGVSIALANAGEAFGYKTTIGGGLIQKLSGLAANIGEFNVYALILALLTFAMIKILLRISIFIPAPLIAIGISAVLAMTAFAGKGIILVKDRFGAIPNNFFVFTPPVLPEMTWKVGFDILYYVVAIAFVSGVESLLCSSMADKLAKNKRTPFNPDKEFWGQGLVQIIAPLLNGFPCTGALARTATSIKAGAVSPLAGYFKGILKLGMAYFIAQYLELIPMACIGGILLWVATNMIKVSEIKWVLTQGRFHSALMVYTAVMVPMTDFLTGVLSALIIYGVGVMYFKSQLHVEVFSTRRIEEFIMKQHKIQGSMMNSNKSIKKVILAVDAHGENEAVQKRILEQVQILLSGTQIEVEPVFVLHFDIASIASGLEVEELKGWSEKANQSISKMLRGLRFPKLLVPKILEALEPSKTACVKALDSYARETNVDLIIVGTHGRSGVPRLFLGSFSESLLLHANMPVLVVGPHSESTGKLNRILFPTDFSKPSERLLELVLSLAVQLKAALTIFHAIPHRYIEGISAETPVLAHMHKIIETREKQARAYADIARKRGLDADVVVEVTEGSIDQSILDTTVKIKAEMIAMAAHSGAVSSAFLGSVTRQVVRSASCPVWVLRERRSEG